MNVVQFQKAITIAADVAATPRPRLDFFAADPEAASHRAFVASLAHLLKDIDLALAAKVEALLGMVDA